MGRDCQCCEDDILCETQCLTCYDNSCIDNELNEFVSIIVQFNKKNKEIKPLKIYIAKDKQILREGTTEQIKKYDQLIREEKIFDPPINRNIKQINFFENDYDSILDFYGDRYFVGETMDEYLSTSCGYFNPRCTCVLPQWIEFKGNMIITCDGNKKNCKTNPRFAVQKCFPTTGCGRMQSVYSVLDIDAVPSCNMNISGYTVINTTYSDCKSRGGQFLFDQDSFSCLNDTSKYSYLASRDGHTFYGKRVEFGITAPNANNISDNFFNDIQVPCYSNSVPPYLSYDVNFTLEYSKFLQPYHRYIDKLKELNQTNIDDVLSNIYVDDIDGYNIIRGTNPLYANKIFDASWPFEIEQLECEIPPDVYTTDKFSLPTKDVSVFVFDKKTKANINPYFKSDDFLNNTKPYNPSQELIYGNYFYYPVDDRNLWWYRYEDTAVQYVYADVARPYYVFGYEIQQTVCGVGSSSEAESRNHFSGIDSLHSTFSPEISIQPPEKEPINISITILATNKSAVDKLRKAVSDISGSCVNFCAWSSLSTMREKFDIESEIIRAIDEEKIIYYDKSIIDDYFNNYVCTHPNWGGLSREENGIVVRDNFISWHLVDNGDSDDGIGIYNWMIDGSKLIKLKFSSTYTYYFTNYYYLDSLNVFNPEISSAYSPILPYNKPSDKKTRVFRLPFINTCYENPCCATRSKIPSSITVDITINTQSEEDPNRIVNLAAKPVWGSFSIEEECVPENMGCELPDISLTGSIVATPYSPFFSEGFGYNVTIEQMRRLPTRLYLFGLGETCLPIQAAKIIKESCNMTCPDYEIEKELLGTEYVQWTNTTYYTTQYTITKVPDGSPPHNACLLEGKCVTDDLYYGGLIQDLTLNFSWSDYINNKLTRQDLYGNIQCYTTSRYASNPPQYFGGEIDSDNDSYKIKRFKQLFCTKLNECGPKTATIGWPELPPLAIERASISFLESSCSAPDGDNFILGQVNTGLYFNSPFTFTFSGAGYPHSPTYHGSLWIHDTIYHTIVNPVPIYGYEFGEFMRSLPGFMTYPASFSSRAIYSLNFEYESDLREGYEIGFEEKIVPFRTNESSQQIVTMKFEKTLTIEEVPIDGAKYTLHRFQSNMSPSDIYNEFFNGKWPELPKNVAIRKTPDRLKIGNNYRTEFICEEEVAGDYSDGIYNIISSRFASTIANEINDGLIPFQYMFDILINNDKINEAPKICIYIPTINHFYINYNSGKKTMDIEYPFDIWSHFKHIKSYDEVVDGLSGSFFKERIYDDGSADLCPRVDDAFASCGLVIFIDSLQCSSGKNAISDYIKIYMSNVYFNYLPSLSTIDLLYVDNPYDRALNCTKKFDARAISCEASDGFATYDQYFTGVYSRRAHEIPTALIADYQNFHDINDFIYDINTRSGGWKTLNTYYPIEIYGDIIETHDGTKQLNWMHYAGKYHNPNLGRNPNPEVGTAFLNKYGRCGNYGYTGTFNLLWYQPQYNFLSLGQQLRFPYLDTGCENGTTIRIQSNPVVNVECKTEFNTEE